MIRSGKVRRAKLYYLRDRTGKSARIAEKIKKKIGIELETAPEMVTEDNVAPVVAEIEKKSEPEKKPEDKTEVKKESSEEKK